MAEEVKSKRGRKAGTVVENKETILDVFDFISQTEKNKFARMAESLKVSQNELLDITIKALNADLIPFKVETKTTITLPKKEEK